LPGFAAITYAENPEIFGTTIDFQQIVMGLTAVDEGQKS